MKLTITNIFAVLLGASSLTACGAFSDDTTIELQMYGVANAPAGATGDRDPQFQTYEVQSITLNGESGAATLLDTAAKFKIVDRPQILMSRDASAYEGQSFSSLVIVFGANVVGGNGETPDLSFELAQPTLTLTEPILIEKGKMKTFAIKASWANTIEADIMVAPGLLIEDQ